MMLTEKQFLHIEQRVDEFNEQTSGIHGVDYGDVVYSYFKSDTDKFALRNDWDEGKSNDPFWNEEHNEHSVIVFIKLVVTELNQITQ